jgi:hypothetical protein
VGDWGSCGVVVDNFYLERGMNWTTEIVEKRWNEACERPNIARWKSLESLATMLADAVSKHEPDHISVCALRGVAYEARCRYFDMMPREAKIENQL